MRRSVPSRWFRRRGLVRTSDNRVCTETGKEARPGRLQRPETSRRQVTGNERLTKRDFEKRSAKSGKLRTEASGRQAWQTSSADEYDSRSRQRRQTSRQGRLASRQGQRARQQRRQARKRSGRQAVLARFTCKEREARQQTRTTHKSSQKLEARRGSRPDTGRLHPCRGRFPHPLPRVIISFIFML